VRLEKNVVNRSGAFAGAVRHRLRDFGKSPAIR
jgi:hypothetical protein